MAIQKEKSETLVEWFENLLNQLTPEEEQRRERVWRKILNNLKNTDSRVMSSQQMIMKFNENFDDELSSRVLKIAENNNLQNISTRHKEFIFVSKSSLHFEDLGCFLMEMKNNLFWRKYCLEWKWLEFEDGQVNENDLLEDI